MIDKTVLKQIGFVVGTGWDHEVWVYGGCFWVHFAGEISSGLPDAKISGESSMEAFFKKFINVIKTEVREGAYVDFYK